MIVPILFTTIALIIISFITLSNLIAFPRLRPGKLPQNLPLISVMIPARNEAPVIGETIKHWLTQDYPNYEILLLDDNSDDGTSDIALQTADDDPHLKIIHGQPLPTGWMGKNWACHQMAERANGDILIFTDADVRWQPTALTAIAADITRTNADLYTIWPTQHTITWAERLCVSLMSIVILGYLPVLGTHYAPLSVFGAANGQCMAWKRHAYQQMGGHAAVHDNVLEDVTLARMVKGAGMRLRMTDGNHLIGCRMYTDWPSVRDGYAKNILAGYGGSVAMLLLATVFHWLLFLFPWVWLLLGWATPAVSGWPAWPLGLIILGISIRAVTAAFTHQRIQDALLMPLSVILMTRIAFQAIWWHYTQGGPTWKGRIVRKQTMAGKP